MNQKAEAIAVELCGRYEDVLSHYSMSKKHRKEFAKRCALVCADTHLDSYMRKPLALNEVKLWETIKKEIEKTIER